MRERRLDKRIPCKECRGEQIYSESDVYTPTIYYLNLSVHGAGVFHVGEEPLSVGETYYVFRNGFKRVFYKVCWCKEFEKNTYHSGLKILDAGESCLDLYSQDQSMRKVKYTTRGEGATQLGLW